MTEHECVFPEEREPDGRLILAPCLTCDLPALEALGLAKAEIQELRRGGAPEDAVLVSRIGIVRYLTDDNDVVAEEAVDAQGDDLPLVEALGLLRLTEDSIIRKRMGEVPDDAGD